MRRWHRYIVLTCILLLSIGLPQGTLAAPFKDTDLHALRSYVFSLMNRSRREAGLRPVVSHEGLEKVAQLHSEDTASHFDETSPETREQSYLAHVSSDGRPLSSRFRDAGVDPGWQFAENAGYWIRNPFGNTLEAGKYGIRLIHEGMLAEVPPNDSHRQTLFGPYTHVGIGLALMNEEGSELNAVFLVTDFSRYGEEVLSEGSTQEREQRGVPSRSLLRHQQPTHGGPFLDVTPNDPFAEAIAAMREQGIIQGYPDGTFKATRTVNRAEFLKIVLDTIGFSPIGREFTACFSDVFNQWFAPYVCIAKREGWVTGYSDDTFKPEQTVNRAEAVALTARILALPPPSEPPLSFEDVPADTWFSPALQSIASKGFLPFSGSRFQPRLGMKRGEVAEMLYRATK